MALRTTDRRSTVAHSNKSRLPLTAHDGQAALAVAAALKQELDSVSNSMFPLASPYCRYKKACLLVPTLHRIQNAEPQKRTCFQEDGKTRAARLGEMSGQCNTLYTPLYCNCIPLLSASSNNHISSASP